MKEPWKNSVPKSAPSRPTRPSLERMPVRSAGRTKREVQKSGCGVPPQSVQEASRPHSSSYKNTAHRDTTLFSAHRSLTCPAIAHRTTADHSALLFSSSDLRLSDLRLSSISISAFQFLPRMLLPHVFSSTKNPVPIRDCLPGLHEEFKPFRQIGLSTLPLHGWNAPATSEKTAIPG